MASLSPPPLSLSLSLPPNGNEIIEHVLGKERDDEEDEDEEDFTQAKEVT